MKLGISVCVYFTCHEHIRKADEALQSFKSEDHELHYVFVINKIIPEGLEFLRKYYPNAQYITLDKQESVSKCWNIGIEACFNSGCDYVFVPNTDIVCRYDAIDRLVEFSNKNSQFLLTTMVEYKDLATLHAQREIQDLHTVNHGTLYSAFMIRKELIDQVGKFDENFENAYFEDNDMAYRIIAGGCQSAVTNTSQCFHYGSVTIKNDRDLASRNNISFRKNEQYYIRKWGNTPGREQYKTPFNDPNKTIKDW